MDGSLLFELTQRRPMCQLLAKTLHNKYKLWNFGSHFLRAHKIKIAQIFTQYSKTPIVWLVSFKLPNTILKKSLFFGQNDPKESIFQADKYEASINFQSKYFSNGFQSFDENLAMIISFGLLRMKKRKKSKLIRSEN